MSSPPPTHLKFLALRHLNDLAARLGCDVETLERFGESYHQHDFYSTIRLAKRSKKNADNFRLVYHVKDKELGRIQKDIATAIAAQIELPSSVYGFVGGGSIYKNALKHVGRRIVLVVDIEHFFDSITCDHVGAALKTLGWRPEIAEMLARICTRERRLPQGVATSPFLSNVVFMPYDRRLELLAAQFSCTYTRYADDLTFSGDKVPTEQQIGDILRPDFTLQKNKTRPQPRGRCQYVTGLTVCDNGGPYVPRRMKRLLRLELHYAQTRGLREHCIYREIDPVKFLETNRGRINFIRSVEGVLGRKLKAQLDEIEKAYHTQKCMNVRAVGSSG